MMNVDQITGFNNKLGYNRLEDNVDQHKDHKIRVKNERASLRTHSSERLSGVGMRGFRSRCVRRSNVQMCDVAKSWEYFLVEQQLMLIVILLLTNHALLPQMLAIHVQSCLSNYWESTRA
ncbi:hypothetical protein TKK_0012456 [Trichogramma kaykai]